MEDSTILSITLGVMVVLTTAYGLYLSFGSPSKQLSDPFEDHED